MGFGSLELNTADNNTGLGQDSGGTITTGSNNVLLGAGADVSATAAANRIAIGSGVIATADNSLFTISTASTGTADLANVAGTNLQYVAGTGQIGPAVSSERFKANIEDARDLSGLIESMKVRQYNPIINSVVSDNKEFGLIAEEIVELLPEFVPLDAEKKPYSVNYDRLVVVLIQGFQKLQKELSEVKADLETLRQQR